MPGAFQAGAKERLVCGFVVPSCNHFCSPPQKQDVTEDKGLKKKRVAEDDARRDGREGFGKEEGD